MLVLVIAQIVLAVYAFIYTDELARAAQKGFQSLWEDSQNRPDDLKVLEAIHGIQRGLHCCGRVGPIDWVTRPGGVPSSCCADDANSCNVLTAFQSGCESLLGDVVSGSGMLIAWIAVVFAAFEVKI